MLLHPKQKEIASNPTRFKIIRAGRRSGKTTLEIEEMLFSSVYKDNQNVFYIAPTQKQARSIVWEALKSRLNGIGEANESRLEMKIPTQQGGTSTIYVSGWENRENFRGLKANLIVFDELDTMKDFFIGWQEIFRPALTDTSGKATFIGTPKKENPNLRRLEKLAETDDDYVAFHYRTEDNPYIPRHEIEKARNELDYDTYQQEYEAEYLENQGSLFSYTAIIDTFSNTINTTGEKYLIVDIADDGSDKTKFSFWRGLEEYRRESYARLNTEMIVKMIREYAQEEKIAYSNIAVDAIGVGAGVASNSLLDGIVGFKSSYGAIRTDDDITRLPNVHYTSNAPLTTEYKNLRSQCVFKLAQLVNNHEISSLVTGKEKENIIEELSQYQDVSSGDGKRQATAKEDIKAIIGRSPDDSDTWVMRMYFVIVDNMKLYTSEQSTATFQRQNDIFDRNKRNKYKNSAR